MIHICPMYQLLSSTLPYFFLFLSLLKTCNYLKKLELAFRIRPPVWLLTKKTYQKNFNFELLRQQNIVLKVPVF